MGFLTAKQKPFLFSFIYFILFGLQKQRVHYPPPGTTYQNYEGAAYKLHLSLCPNCARDVLFYPFWPIQQDIKTATYVRSMDGRRPAPPGIHKTSDLRCFKSATNAMLMPDRGIAVVLLGSIGYLHFRRLCRLAPSGISWSHLCKLRSICSNNLTSLRTIKKADQKPDPEGALAVFPDCGHCHAIQSSMRQRPQEIKKLNQVWIKCVLLLQRQSVIITIPSPEQRGCHSTSFPI